MPVLSLHSLALATAKKNLADIEDVGELPFEMVRPILMKLTSVEQLVKLEDNSPHLVGHTDEIWQQLIRKLLHVDAVKPQHPKNWRRVYAKLRREQEAREARSREALKASLDSLKQERDATTTTSLKRVVAPKQAVRRFAGPGAPPKEKITAGTSFLKKTRATQKEQPIFLPSSRKPPIRTPRSTTTAQGNANAAATLPTISASTTARVAAPSAIRAPRPMVTPHRPSAKAASISAGASSTAAIPTSAASTTAHAAAPAAAPKPKLQPAALPRPVAPGVAPKAPVITIRRVPVPRTPKPAPQKPAPKPAPVFHPKPPPPSHYLPNGRLRQSAPMPTNRTEPCYNPEITKGVRFFSMDCMRKRGMVGPSKEKLEAAKKRKADNDAEGQPAPKKK